CCPAPLPAVSQMVVWMAEVVAPSELNSTEFCVKLWAPRCRPSKRIREPSVRSWLRSVVFCVGGSEGVPIGPEGRLFNAGFVPLCVSVYLFVPASKVRRYLLLLATARL